MHLLSLLRRRSFGVAALHVDINALGDDLVEFVSDILLVGAHLEDSTHLLCALLNCLLHLLTALVE